MTPNSQARRVAKASGVKTFVSPRSCKHGHGHVRYVCDNRCVVCGRLRNANQRVGELSKGAAWRLNNLERHRVLCREWFAKNYDPQKAALRYANNKHAMRAQHREYRQRCPDVHCAAQARRRAGRLTATPAWADLAAIKIIYETARLLKQADGITRHVDHIVPLKAKNACGLHVENNLRIVHWQDNIRKSNRMEVA